MKVDIPVTRLVWKSWSNFKCLIAKLAKATESHFNWKSDYCCSKDVHVIAQAVPSNFFHDHSSCSSSVLHLYLRLLLLYTHAQPLSEIVQLSKVCYWSTVAKAENTRSQKIILCFLTKRADVCFHSVSFFIWRCQNFCRSINDVHCSCASYAVTV